MVIICLSAAWSRSTRCKTDPSSPLDPLNTFLHTSRINTWVWARHLLWCPQSWEQHVSCHHLYPKLLKGSLTSDLRVCLRIQPISGADGPRQEVKAGNRFRIDGKEKEEKWWRERTILHKRSLAGYGLHPFCIATWLLKRSNVYHHLRLVNILIVYRYCNIYGSQEQPKMWLFFECPYLKITNLISRDNGKNPPMSIEIGF